MTNYFSTLPPELALAVNQNLAIKDKLSLADTCQAYRFLMPDAECNNACMNAGLSIPPNIGARAMTRLLSRPRVGVCNWSYEGGLPKEDLEFSLVHSISSAIRNKLRVAFHPVFMTARWMYVGETQSFEDVRLRVSRNEPDIALCKQRLYLHEYVTSPPLDELRIMIMEDELGAPLSEDMLVFRIQNSTGVTLGNYYEGFFRFLYQAPFEGLIVTNQVYMKYCHVDYWAERPLDMNDEKYNRDCPTHLAMLNIWCERICGDFSFSEKGLMCRLPLYTADLTMVISGENPDTIETLGFSSSLDQNVKWGEPFKAPEGMLSPRVPDEVFWRDYAPLIEF